MFGDDRREMTPLHVALDNNCLDIAKMLIEKGADIDAKNNVLDISIISLFRKCLPFC